MDPLLKENLITTKDAGELSGYTSDYLARLARSGKIAGKRIGHSWLIDRESLSQFLDQQGDRKIDYARALARAREAEYLLHQDARRNVARRVLLHHATKTLTHSSPVSELGIAKSSLSGQVLALSIAFLVVISGALAAQTAIVPHVAEKAKTIAYEFALGFSATFGDVPLRIASKVSAVNDEMRARPMRVAVQNSLSSARIASPTLAAFDFSSARMASFDEFENASRHFPEKETFASVPFASSATPKFSAQALRSSAFGAYAFFTDPSRAINYFVNAYRTVGVRSYATINSAFSVYQSLIEQSGARALSLAATTRDVLATAPRLVNRLNLAFGTSIIEATHALIRADVTVAYGLANAAPESARATVALIGGAGDMLARTTAHVPTLATNLFLGATALPSTLAPDIAQAVFDAEYAGATRFVAFFHATSERYLALVEGTGRLVYDGTVSGLSLSRAAKTFLARAPAALEDAYLGVLGKSALALKPPPLAPLETRTQGILVNFQSASLTGLAAALPAFSVGERTALTTYKTVSGFFSSMNRALAVLLGSPPTIVLPSGVPKARVTTTPATGGTSPAPLRAQRDVAYTTIVNGISSDYVNRSLAALRTDILAVVAGMVQPVAAQVATNVTTIQQVNMIQDLSNLIVRNGDFRGGRFDAGEVRNASLVETADLSVSDHASIETLDVTTATSTSLFVTGTTATSTLSTGGLAVGTSQFVVQQSSGKVGIGISNPTNLFSVSGVNPYLDVTSNARIGIGTTTPGAQLDIYNQSQSTVEEIIRLSGVLVAVNAGKSIDWYHTLANAYARIAGVIDSTGSTGELAFYTNDDLGSTVASEALRIKGNGNVGIGSSTPGTLLSLGNTGNDTINISATATSTFGSGINLRSGCFAIGGSCLGNGTVTSISTNNGLTGGTITTSGTIGLNVDGLATNSLVTWNGTNLVSTSTGPLTVNSLISTTTANSGFGTTTPWGFLSINPNALGSGVPAFVIGSSSATHFIIDGAGKVGIGTTTPGSLLSVAGDSYTSGFLNTSGTTGGFKIDGNLILQASSTNFSTLVGQSVGVALTATGLHNTAVGYEALMTNTFADDNTAVGYQALRANTGSNNTANGSGALSTNTTGGSNTANGYNALTANTTGGSNTVQGAFALAANTTGSNNTASGYAALNANTTGGSNAAHGYSALSANTTGSNNAAVGRWALRANTTGSNNAAQGYQALRSNTTADYNTALGYQAGYNITTGYGNILIGATPNTGGDNLTTGFNNIGIGYNALFPSSTGNNQLSIGNFIYSMLPATSSSASFTLPTSGALGIATSSPYATLSVHANNGSTNTTLFAVGSSTASATTTLFSISNTGAVVINGLTSSATGNAVCITTGKDITDAAAGSCTPSSIRFKQNVETLVSGTALGLIDKMRVVSFDYKNGFYSPEENPASIGLIAEEVEKIDPRLVDYGYDGLPQTIHFERLTGLSIQAIQQLDARTNWIALASSTATTSVSLPVLTLDASTGNIGIGNGAPTHTLDVAGEIAATAFVNTSTRSAKTDIVYATASSTENMFNQLVNLKVATYRYKIEDQSDPLHLGFIAEDAQTIAPEILSTDGKGVDLYKLATFTLAGVQTLAAKLDAQSVRMTSLETRLTSLENGAVSSASNSPITLSTTSLASAMTGLGVLIQKGIAQFNTLVFRQLVASKDADGTSSAGSVTILTGNTVAQVNNSLVKPSTKIFVTFNSQITGSWWVSDKAEGSFRVILSAPQTVDVSFDYFFIQTEGQIDPKTSNVGSQSNGPDTEAPVITLLGDNPVHVSVGDAFTDPGITVTDTVDSSVPYVTFVNGIQQPVSSIDTGSQMTYIITYSATDAAGNFSTATRSVIVGSPNEIVATTVNSTPSSTDTTAPVVTLIGAPALQIPIGGALTDPGATAADDTDGDLTAKIVVTGAVDSATAGLYTLTYTATDAAGNTGNVSRVATVVAEPHPAGDTPSQLPSGSPAAGPVTEPAPEPLPTDTTATPSGG